MSLRKELPCPHCGAPIFMKLADYIPSRSGGSRCPACSCVSRPPFISRLMAVTILCCFYFVVLAVLKPLGILHPETVWGVVGEGVVFLLMVLLAMPVTGLFCRAFVRRLVR
jgi:hypothetical protein